MPLGVCRAYYGKVRTLISVAYLSGRTCCKVKVKLLGLGLAVPV